MKEKIKTTELGLRLKLYRAVTKTSFRMLQKETGISNPTLWRIEHGNSVDYETGKILEEFLDKNPIPEPCEHCNGKGYYYKIT